MTIIDIICKLLPDLTAYAHCDIPCGIYDPKPAQIAALTILKMTQKIIELPTDVSGDKLTETRNAFVRMVWTKEEHARILRHELMVLWADYFKEEHLEKFPDLHTKFWKAMKLVSKNKQSVGIDAAQDLVKVVDEVADIFRQTKQS